MQAAGDSSGKKTIMIGDRFIDILGAKSAGIDSIAVEWGTASEGEFERYKPTYIVNKPRDILDILMNT